jgi:hypothetical protein
MDSAAVKKLGASPLAPHLGQVRVAATRDAIAALMGCGNRAFNGSIFSVYVDVDLKNPKIYAVYLNQAGLGLPDRDYYLTPGFAAPLAAYQRYAARLLHLIGWPEADARARDIVAFEDGDRGGKLDEGAATRRQRRVQPDDGGRPRDVRTRVRLDRLSRKRGPAPSRASHRRRKERVSEDRRRPSRAGARRIQRRSTSLCRLGAGMARQGDR